MIIKSFKLFEMYMSDINIHVDDYLYPFSDEGFKVDKRINRGMETDIYLQNINGILFSKIVDDLIRLMGFILKNRYKYKITQTLGINKLNSSYKTYIIDADDENWEKKLIDGIGINSIVQVIDINIK